MAEEEELAPTGINLDQFTLDYAPEEEAEEEVPETPPEETPASEETPAEDEPETPAQPDGGAEDPEEDDDEPATPEEQPEDTPPADTPPVAEGDLSFTPYAQALFDVNGWKWDESLMKTNDLNSFNDLVKNIIDANVDAALKESSPFANDQIQRMNELVSKGAKPEEAYQALFSQMDYDKADLTDESIQETIVRRYLNESTGFSEDRIEKEIKRYKDLDEMEEMSKEGIDVLKQIDADKDKNLEKQLEEQETAQAQARVERLEATKQSILTADKIAGYKMDKKLAAEFIDYAFKPDEKTGRSAYQEFVASTPDWDIQAAMIAFKKLGKDTVDARTETEATKMLRERIFGKKGEKKKDNNSAPQKPNRIVPKGDNPSGKKKTDYDDFLL